MAGICEYGNESSEPIRGWTFQPTEPLLTFDGSCWMQLIWSINEREGALVAFDQDIFFSV
jgi:hypothetical protein